MDICAQQDCPFRVSATFNKTLGCAKDAKVKDEHICVSAAPVGCAVSSSQAWLQRILPTIIAIDKNTTPSQIRDAVKLHHQVTISYNAAKKAKKHLLGEDLEVQVARSNVATVGIVSNSHSRKYHLKFFHSVA